MHVRHQTAREASIDVAGKIATDTTWNADTVRVVGNILVEPGVTLQIEPGVRVEFQDFYGIDVQGTLLAIGTPGRRIVFTTAEPWKFKIDTSRPGAWTGIRFDNTSAVNAPSRLEQCVLEYAKAAGGSGGLHPYGGGAVRVVGFSELTIENCILRNNVADYGAAVFLDRGASPRIVGNLIVGNHALVNGSAFYLAYSYPEFVNNTIVGNPIHNQDNLYIETGAVVNFIGRPMLANNIVRGNEPYFVFMHAQLWKNKAYFTRNNNIEAYEGAWGNIDADPVFVDPVGADGVPGTPDDDCRLAAVSPCIDSGLDAAVSRAAATDLDGQARIVDGDAFGDAVVDMGAYEYPHGGLLSFAADGVTLSWPAIGPAWGYNVYRGLLADLVDGDGDGLPDEGFGECVNGLDSDTSDTTFVDTSVPAAGNGFFYLMSFVSESGEELLLGATSAGMAREVLAACP